MVKYWKKLGHQKLGSGEETDNLTIEWSGTYTSIKVIGTFLADGGSIEGSMTFNNNTDSNCNNIQLHMNTLQSSHSLPLL